MDFGYKSHKQPNISVYLINRSKMGNCCSDQQRAKQTTQHVNEKKGQNQKRTSPTQESNKIVSAPVKQTEEVFQSRMKNITQSPIGQGVFEDSQMSSKKGDESSCQSDVMNDNEKRQIETAYQEYKINKKKKIGEYDVEKVIGRGAFGQINLELSLRGTRYSVKVIPVNRKNRQHQIEEATNLQSLDHKHIAKIKENFLFDKDQYLSIVNQYCPGGNLSQVIGKLEDKKIQIIMHGIAEAVQHFHGKAIVHRDLRPQNIFFDSENQIKVSNFGQIRSIKSRQNTVVGLQSYMSLEVLMGFTYGKQADIWALGIIFTELILGKRIWVIEGNQEPSTKDDFPSERIMDAIENKLWANMIKGMLVRETKDRLNIAQVIKCLNGEGISPRKKKVGKKEYQDGYYEGQLYGGVPEGYGTYFWNNGNKYQGQWKNKQLNGRGVATYINGDKYDGQWKDGGMNGWGIYYNANGSRFEGQLRDGILNGRGVIYYADGDSYEGHFKDSRKHGTGIEIVKGKKFQVKYKMDKCVRKNAI